MEPEEEPRLYFCTETKNSVIYKGHEYRSHKIGKEKDDYKCKRADRRQYPCPGRLALYDDGRIMENGVHNHDPILYVERLLLFRKELMSAAANESGSMREIWNSVERDFSDVAVYTSLDEERHRMQHARRKKQIKGDNKVRSVQDFADYLKKQPEEHVFVHQNTTKNKPDIKLKHFVVEEQGNTHIILVATALLSILKLGKINHLDSTFGSRPTLTFCRQLLTVMIRMYDKAWPCIWVIMSSKSKDSYKAVFEKIREFWPEWDPGEVHSDFEEGMQNAFKETFPNPRIKIIGCWFHYCQALFKNALKWGAAIKRNAINNPQQHLILLRMMALALIPENNILAEFLNIKNDALIFGDLFEAFFVYFQDYWIWKRKPKTFCVYNQRIRTNNAEESYHRDLHIFTRHKRPTVWRLINILLLYVENLLIDLEREEKTFTKHREKKTSALNDEKIEEWWNQLNNGTLSPRKLIENASAELGHVKKKGNLMEVLEGDAEMEAQVDSGTTAEKNDKPKKGLKRTATAKQSTTKNPRKKTKSKSKK